MSTKICPLCNKAFESKSPRQKYCNREIERECAVCSKVFISQCNPSAPEVCSKSCASKAASKKLFTCAICGKEFHPASSRQKYCKTPIIQKCEICGNDYETFCGDVERHTCTNKKCRDTYAHQQSQNFYMKTTRICEWCGKEFHPTTNTQKYCNERHYSTCKICGKIYPIGTINADTPKTCSEECSLKLRFQNGNPFQDPQAREKAKQTMIEKYGVDHPMKIPGIVDKISATYKDKTGYDHPSHNPAVRSKSYTSFSKLEQRVCLLLDQYNIEYKIHYTITQDDASHEFDIYIPKYKILIDCDGVYYHGYLSDPDGKRVLDCYDESRLALIPRDHIFHVIVEGDEERGIKFVVDAIKKMDNDVFDYEGELFKWCRSIEFPYPIYTKDRMVSDYNSLCKYTSTKYNPFARLGDSIIQNFHRSMYDARVGNYVSPVEAWYNDDLLKKVILNRLIYKNDVDPFKILKGFNISKICPRVSVFNPVLAKHLIVTYLGEFSSVFDPFSGFSGRLIGCLSTGKRYVGQDLNEHAVKETNQIIDFLDAHDRAQVTQKNILEDSGEYDCLLTCPPYNSKEHYSDEVEFKTCDEWISYILDAYKCKKYVFVIDKTIRYQDHVVESIRSTSHFSKVLEQVIVLEK